MARRVAACIFAEQMAGVHPQQMAGMQYFCLPSHLIFVAASLRGSDGLLGREPPNVCSPAV